MSANIPTHFVQQYTSNLQLLLQQKGSVLRDSVMVGSYVGKQAVAVDQLGQVAATKRTTRYPPITPNDTPTDRRWVAPSDYDWPELIDSIDKLRLLADPTSSYVTNGTYALGRAMDDEIVAAYFAASKTGEAGSGTTSFPSAQQVVVTTGAAAATGMNVAKLRAAKKILMAAQVDLDSDPLTVVVTATQHDNLLAEAQISSLDFNEKPVLVDGKVTRFMGFTVKHCERLAVNGSSYRRCPAYAKSGMHLGIWNDITASVDQRKDLRGLPWQVYVYGTFGATRLEEGKVTEIICAE